MERQRSFSFRPTRLLVLSSTIASSIIFILFFTNWLTKTTTNSVPLETQLQFNTSSLTLGLGPKTVTFETLQDNSSASEVKDSTLIDTQLTKQENISGFLEISVVGDLQRENSETQVVEEEEEREQREQSEGDGIIGNFTSTEDERIEVPITESKTWFDKSDEKSDKEEIVREKALGLKKLTFETLQDNSSVSEVKDSILIDTQLTKQENISGVLEFSVVVDLQRENSETQGVEEQKKEESEGDGIIGNFTSTKVPIGEKIEIRETSINKSSIVEKVEEKKRIRECDVTIGKWVYDENFPLYTNVSCPFIDEGFDCVGNGRLDTGYMKLRWQPEDCDIPRFNATKMLELLRGKRLVFVGDSLNRNQWESMLCMLMGGIKDPKKVYETRERRITKEKGNYSFKFVDYKCTVEYYVTHFLVHEGKGRVGQKRVQTLQIDTIDRGSSRWKAADILVFNTAHWWSHFKTKAGVNYYQEGGQVHPRLDVSVAFRKALTTWASWVDKQINPRKTRVFFRSSAPSHFRGGQWNSGGHCKEVTLPIPEISSHVIPEKSAIVEEVIKEMRTPVTVLNITASSDYRIDGHPSTFGKRRPSSRIQDCSHWCLPGVPDSWNELLYAHLLSKPASTLVDH